MTFLRQTSRMLDEEHRANLELLEKIERGFAHASPAAALRDAALGRLAGQLQALLTQDVGRHFDFEERELFPRMAEAGESDIAMLLTEEHDALRAVAETLLPLTRAAATGELDAAGWQHLKRETMELIERQVAHIQKETMALLPLLDDLLDEDADRELALGYAAG
ncbi:MAG: hemerythrin domain-containing protein [Betaproteobacteria bacterium]